MGQENRVKEDPRGISAMELVRPSFMLAVRHAAPIGRVARAERLLSICLVFCGSFKRFNLDLSPTAATVLKSWQQGFGPPKRLYITLTEKAS